MIIFAYSGGRLFGNSFLNSLNGFFYIHQEIGLYIGMLTITTTIAAISGFYATMSRLTSNACVMALGAFVFFGVMIPYLSQANFLNGIAGTTEL
jgi:hypothetical protein